MSGRIFLFFSLIAAATTFALENGSDSLGATVRVGNQTYFTTNSSQSKPKKIADFNVHAYDIEKNELRWSFSGPGYSYTLLANDDHDVFVLIRDENNRMTIRKIDGKNGIADPSWDFEIKKEPKDRAWFKYIGPNGLPVYALNSSKDFSLRQVLSPDSEKILPFNPLVALDEKFYVRDIQPLDSGNILVTGFGQNILTPKSSSDVVLAVLNANNKVIWKKVFTPFGELYRDSLYAANVIDGFLYTATVSQPIGDTVGVYKARTSKFSMETGKEIWSKDSIEGGRVFHKRSSGDILFSTYYQTRLLDPQTGDVKQILNTSLYGLSNGSLGAIFPLEKENSVLFTGGAKKHFSRDSNTDVLVTQMNLETGKFDDSQTIVIDGPRHRRGVRSFPIGGHNAVVNDGKILFTGGYRFFDSVGGSGACCDRNLYTFNMDSETWKRKRLYKITDTSGLYNDWQKNFIFNGSLFYWGARRLYEWNNKDRMGFKIHPKTIEKTYIKGPKDFHQRGGASPTTFDYKGKRKLFMYGGLVARSWGKDPLSFQDGGIFDFETETWTKIKSEHLAKEKIRNLPTIHHAKGKVLVWGGLDGDWDGSFLDSGAIYDLETETWTPMPSKGAPSRRTVSTADGHKVHFLESDTLNIYTFDTTNLTWSSVDTAIPKAKYNSVQQIHRVEGGFFVVVSAWSSKSEHVFGRISLDGTSFAATPPLPGDFKFDGFTGWSTYTFHKDKLYILGSALKKDDPKGTNHLLTYNLVTNRWDTIPVVF